MAPSAAPRVGHDGHDIVVIGASAGGVEAIREVVSRLPETLQAAVFVVVHLPRGNRSFLPEILNRSGPLPSSQAEDGDPIRRGAIYVAPPDHHLLLENGRIRLARGPHHNRRRPAIDPLFWSAAKAYSSRVVGVVLSGTLDDGTAGLATIKARGGIAIVQDPKTAAFSGMPTSALAYVDAECVPLSEIGPAIARAVEREAPAFHPPEPAQLGEVMSSVMGDPTDMERIGKPSIYACPECHGTLWEYDQDGVPQYRCRVGHSFTAESLLAEHDGSLEATLWAALRALEENTEMRRRLAERMEGLRQPQVAGRYRDRARESERHASTLRDLLTSEQGPSATPSEES